MDDEDYKIFTDAWRVFKNYRKPVEDRAFWAALVKDCYILANRHQGSPFATDMAIVIRREVERKFLKEKEEELKRNVIDTTSGFSEKEDGARY